MKKILVVLLSGLVLTACNSGGGSSGGGGSTTTDTQTVTYNSYQLGSGGANTSNLSETFTANNCRIIAANGTCTMSITYSLVGTYPNPILLSLVTNTGGTFDSNYTSNISSCPQAPITGQQQSCTVTITNTNPAAITAAQAVRVAPSGAGNFTMSPPITNNTFVNIGGGMN